MVIRHLLISAVLASFVVFLTTSMFLKPDQIRSNAGEIFASDATVPSADDIVESTNSIPYTQPPRTMAEVFVRLGS